MTSGARNWAAPVAAPWSGSAWSSAPNLQSLLYVNFSIQLAALSYTLTRKTSSSKTFSKRSTGYMKPTDYQRSTAIRKKIRRSHIGQGSEVYVLEGLHSVCELRKMNHQTLVHFPTIVSHISSDMQQQRPECSHYSFIESKTHAERLFSNELMKQSPVIYKYRGGCHELECHDLRCMTLEIPMCDTRTQVMLEDLMTEILIFNLTFSDWNRIAD